MTKITDIPAIRFKGFSDTWEQRKLCDVVKEITRNDPESEAPIMMITANNGFIEQSERYAFNNAGESLKKYILLKKGELAYNHGASKLRPYGSCFALTTAENARIPFVYHCFSAENQNAEFMSIELNGAEIENQLRKIVSSGARMDGLLNISFDEYTSVSVLLPGIEEQDCIADFFRQLDNLITLHQRKYDKLTNVKKSMLEKMFPQNGSNAPEIRFKGFTEAWEQRKFGDIGSIAMCKRIFKEQTSDEGEVPFYKIGTFGVEPDAFISKELFDEYKTKYPYPNKGDILISASGSIGRTVEFTGKDEYFQDSNIVWLKHGNEIDNSFLKVLYSIVEWSCEGSTIKRLYNDNFLKTEFMLPQIDEQIKLGTYFSNLDNLITLHQRKCDETKKLKKFMLQKMFPKKDAKKPEIRFAGFTDDWEQRKLVDVVDVRSGRDYKHLEEGDIPVYGTGGYMLSVNEALSDDEDAIGIGRKGTIDNPYILRAPFWTVDTLFYAVPRDKYDLNFVFDIFQNVNWKAKDESTGVPSLSKATINAVETLMPEYAEQKKIGEYFSYLDNFITLHQRKCDELKEFKKYMLQNMFPQKG